MSKPLTFSIVINTLNRAACLQQTLNSFRWLKYKGEFEVIVVNGPSTDNSDEIINAWLPRIRAGRCAVPNLSVSRNIGLCMAQGDIVAFIDDDAIPEPEWLEQLAAGYDSLEVGAAGGMVFDHTGYNIAYKYCLTDRFATPDHSSSAPSPHLSFPGSFHFPHLLGTNASFRRSALLEIGGFDEEYEYFLDETDVCLRIVDAGYLIKQLPNAYVHHKFAPSTVRNTSRATKYQYPIIKNKLYFAVEHARDYVPLERIVEELRRFIRDQRKEVQWCLERGLLADSDAQTFEQEAEKALEVGMARGLEGPREMITPAKLQKYSGRFSPFAPISVAVPLAIVLISRDFPPGHSGGIATFNKDLAMALAALGHTVHVVAESKDHNRVDFEDGVWVHRVVVREIERSIGQIETKIPSHIWDWSATALREVQRIAAHRRIDVVEAPIWDCQGAAFLSYGEWPLVTSLQTTLKFWLEAHPELVADKTWMRSFGDPMLRLEQELMQKSDAVRSISSAIRRDIEHAYGFRFEDEQVFVSPLGLVPTARNAESPASDGTTTVLFVGRLEARKGIDVLFNAIPLVLNEAPHVRFRIVGDNTLAVPGGGTYQSHFSQTVTGKRVRGHVSFEGKLDDEELQNAYKTCDVFTAPSRYESFGLIFLEAMREGKPVIGCLVGGVPEIVEHEGNGFLVPPGDERSLAQAIIQLVRCPELRAKMGKRGLNIFEEKFTAARMAKDSLDLYALAIRRHFHSAQGHATAPETPLAYSHIP